MSGIDKTFPPDIDFETIVVARPTLGFLDLAAAAIPIKEAVTFIAGLRKLSHAF